MTAEGKGPQRQLRETEYDTTRMAKASFESYLGNSTRQTRHELERNAYNDRNNANNPVERRIRRRKPVVWQTDLCERRISKKRKPLEDSQPLASIRHFVLSFLAAIVKLGNSNTTDTL
jgi:hypothetical protein